MVTIVDCVERINNEGNPFIALIVQNELEIVKSAHGSVYVAARKASVPCNLDFNTAKMMIGKELPGTIEKVQCHPYEHLASNGEVVTLHHRYNYIPEENRTNFQEEEISLEELELEAEEVH